MNALDDSCFTLHGVFAGFFRNIFGKRRLVLRTAEGEMFLKVPKGLRHGLERSLRAGQEIVVTGRDRLDGGRHRRIVLGVHVAGQEAAAIAPIRVCAKKNCWRSGGKALWCALEEGIAKRGASGSVELVAVGCLGHCKRAPNLEWGGQEYNRCSPADVERILAAISEPLLNQNL